MDNCLSLCFPCSTKYDAIGDFKFLQPQHQVLVGSITAIVAILTLPIFCLLAVLTFRCLVEKFSVKVVDVKFKNAEKVQEQALKTISQQEPKILKGNELQVVPAEVPQKLEKPVQPIANERIDYLKRINAPPIFLAIVNRDKEEVEKLIQEGCDLSIPIAPNFLPIHCATYEGDLDILKLIALKTPNINVENGFGVTALSMASASGKIDMVKFLAEQGAQENLAINQNKNSALHRAAENGHLEIVQFFISKNKDYINAKDEKGNTSLALASMKGKAEVVKFLLANGADANLFDNDGKLPLHHAVCQENLIFMQDLYKATADINKKDINGNTPLALASKVGNADAVKFLLDRKANVNICNNNRQLPLHLAAKEGHLNVVKLLYPKMVILINAQDNWGDTPLTSAVAGNKADVAKFLLSKGANANLANDDKEMPLHFVVRYNDLQLLEDLYLVTDVNINEHLNGNTPLSTASKYGHPEIIKFLLDRQADPNIADEENILPIHIAAVNGHLEALKLLIPETKNINAVDDEGSTTLLNAVYGNKEGVVKYLLEQNANANIPDMNEQLPLYWAVDQENIENVKLLIPYTDNINAQNDKGSTVLHIAAHIKNNPGIMIYLLDKGAKFVINNKGESPFHTAAKQKNLKALKILIERFPTEDINLENYEDMTPLGFARENNDDEMVQFLLANGAKDD